MAVSDPVADMLTRIRNAVTARHDYVLVPASEMKSSIAKILKQEGFITDYEMLKDKQQPMLRIHLKYVEGQPAVLGLERVSRPGLRVYVGQGEIPRVYSGLGISILSTPKGIMTGHEAWRRHLGGELLAYVW